MPKGIREYSLTIEERIALRDACIEEAQRCKHLTSERAVRRVAVLRSLAESFAASVMAQPCPTLPAAVAE